MVATLRLPAACALLTPFAERPLASLAMRFTGIDPAVFAPDVPHALLDIDAMLQSKSADGSAVSGELSVSNQRAGALDQQRIPVERPQTGLDCKTDGGLSRPDAGDVGRWPVQGPGRCRRPQNSISMRTRSTLVPCTAISADAAGRVVSRATAVSARTST